MRPVKAVFGVIGALLPVLYCGGLFFYFRGFDGWSDGPLATGLGPTMLGLGALGLLFLIPLAVKLVRLATRAAGPAAPGGADPEPESSFDADAALARYLARKAAQGGEAAAAAPADAPAPRPSFGRKPV